ncbi:sensor histidine kinase [Nocardioides litoris]|uniref:sensor histidine kinase n=1 Tax=Nocardioides litoris TaxID=1926648 RepID=UPI00111CA88F|nr:HAMP domain-containing sensor histidine kinase [Nocardioides litoris]
MTDTTPQHRAQIDVTTWSDASSRAALDLVASSVAEMVGFEIAIISVVRGEVMYSVSVEGSNEAVQAMLGLATPVSMIESELARADDWGRFRFVPHDRLANDDHLAAFGWVPDLTPLDTADAWDPLDLLIAPLYGEDGDMIGLLSIDVPLSGRRPGRTQRHLLERYAAQAERTLRVAFERDALAERLRLAEVARRVVRFATTQDDLASVLHDCRAPLLEGFRSDYVAIRTYATGDLAPFGTSPTILDEVGAEAVRAMARRAWADERVVVHGDLVAPDPALSEEERAVCQEAITNGGLGSILLVPMGDTLACHGHVALGRKDPLLAWSPDEQRDALEVARDIAHAVVRLRTQERERRLVAELRRLATYRSQLLSTVSHELKNPLAAVLGYAEVLDTLLPEAGDGRRALGALARAATRLGGVVDDLLVLAEVEDPDSAAPTEPFDALPVVLGAIELTRITAARREVTVELTAPEGAVLVCCDAGDLDRVVTNLLSNAIKYSPAASTVSVVLAEHDDEVEVAVRDEGIGISAEDQERLFTEFFRSTNPAAVAEPGTGLGLTICRRIVERHGGRIEVDSTLGEGSTFRVLLPTPA